MNLRHRLRKLEARIPPPRKQVVLVYHADGVPWMVCLPGREPLTGDEARKYLEEEDYEQAGTASQ